MNDPLLQVILYIAGAIVTLSSALTVLYKVFKKSILNISEDLIVKQADEMQKKIQLSSEEMLELIKKYETFLEQQKDVIEDLKHTFMLLCRDRINQAFDYYTTKGFIGNHSLFILDELFDKYESYGGNGHTKEQMKILHSLDLLSAEQLTKLKRTGEKE